MLYRQFTKEESSAIYCISVLHNNVTIAWHSKPENQYIFRASDDFAPVIRDLVRHFNPAEHSVGKLIDKARKAGDLEIINI